MDTIPGGGSAAMSWRVRPARAADLPALMDLARLTGGGFTNLPADEAALAERLAWSDASYARFADAPDDELYILLLEQTATGRIGGCGMVDPVVFQDVGYDPEVWSGYAFGMGLERLAMLLYGIDDIRYLYQNDVRFLRQFA
jgi:hypothetical protein